MPDLTPLEKSNQEVAAAYRAALALTGDPQAAALMVQAAVGQSQVHMFGDMIDLYRPMIDFGLEQIEVMRAEQEEAKKWAAMEADA